MNTANKCTTRFSSTDCSCSPTNSAPKPNTRFLQSILRETDSHNAALKRKEELEARLRLQNVTSDKARSAEAKSIERRKRRREVDDGRDLRASKRRSHRPREEEDSRAEKSNRHSHQHRPRTLQDDKASRDDYRTRKHRHRASSRQERDAKNRPCSPDEDRRHRRRRYSSSGALSPDRYRSRRHKRERHIEHSRRQASCSLSHSTTSSPSADDRRKTSSHPEHEARKKPPPSPTPSSLSDPLENIVGPLPQPPPKPAKTITDPPPLTSRGRGSYRPSSSTIDAHFSSTYDPTLDLHPPSSPSASDHEKEDWDLALEALRDREIWKKKGAERLKEAGFGDEEVRKWEESANGREKGVEDVRWRGKGEEREWDAGKAVVVQQQDDEAERKGKVVGLEAAWRRKDGGFIKEMKRALG